MWYYCHHFQIYLTSNWKALSHPHKRVSSASSPSLTVAAASGGTERRKAAFQKSCVPWSAEIHSRAGTSHILTRPTPVLTRLAWFRAVTGLDNTHLGRLRWNISRAASFAHMQVLGLCLKGCERGISSAALSTTHLSTCIYCMLTRICSSYAQSCSTRFEWVALQRQAQSLALGVVRDSCSLQFSVLLFVHTLHFHTWARKDEAKRSWTSRDSWVLL